MPRGQGVVGHVYETGEVLNLADAYAHPRFYPEVDRRSGFKTRSLIAVPLRHAGRVTGVVEVLHGEPDAFDADAAALVEAVAGQVAAVLDNVLLYDALRRQNEQLLATKEELSG